MKTPTSSEQDIQLQAAQWLVELEDIDRPVDARQQREWLSWLQASPRHVKAYFDIMGISQEAEEVPMKQRARIRQLLAANRNSISPADARVRVEGKESRGTFVFMRPAWMISAAAAVCAIVGITWFAAGNNTYSSGVGEQIVYRLEDGSSMTLNTRSRARVSMDDAARVVELAGEAYFSVARDPGRPFLVRTRSATAQAIGTAFNVYERVDGTTKVSVVEGSVQMSSPRDTVLLLAGEEAETHRDAVEKRETVNIHTAIAWKQKTLVFQDATLAEVATQFNRYNEMQFIIEPAVARERRLSGTFDPYRPRYFQAFLERDETLKISGSGKEIRVSLR